MLLEDIFTSLKEEAFIKVTNRVLIFYFYI
jgi:hypothetical protein